MKRTFAILAIAAVSGFSFAQEAGLTVQYDIRSKSTNAAVMVPIGTWKNVNAFGVMLGDIQISTLFGAQSNAPLGFGGTSKRSLGDNLWLHGGIGVNLESLGGDRVGFQWSLLAGATWRF